MDVDVAVAVTRPPPREGVGEERAPDLPARESVDRQSVRVLEHHHCAPCDLVEPIGTPERPELRRRVRVAPEESARRRRDGGGELRLPRWARRVAGGSPAERQVAELRKEL